MWNTNIARKSVDVNQIVKYIRAECFRPFDNRFIFYHEKFVARLNRRIMQHLDQKNNIALVTVRQLASLPFEHIYVTDNLTDQHIISVRTKEGGVIFPLYLHLDTNKPQELQQKKHPNFSPSFLKTLQSQLGYLPTPEAIFYYIYAIFHSPTYRTRYAEFLKIDFPRVPLTSNDNLFRQLADYGEQLVQLHLMTSPTLTPNPSPTGRGEQEKAPLMGDLSFVSKSDKTVAAGHPKYSKGEVHINKQGDCFKGVPEEVWNFYIGGYQVCQKWLKDRKERTLSDEDILHYQKIVVALAETIKLMQLIDAAIPSFPIE
jgi:predicted helicase